MFRALEGVWGLLTGQRATGQGLGTYCQTSGVYNTSYKRHYLGMYVEPVIVMVDSLSEPLLPFMCPKHGCKWSFN